MKSKNFFWGILLITFGILWMLKALSVISFSWCVLLKLWPLIFVWVGIKLMPIQDKWKIIFNVSVLLIGIAFLLILSNSKYCNHKWTKSFWWDREWNYTCNHDDVDNDTIAYYNRNFIAYDENYENANLKLDAAAGKLIFTTGENLITIQEKKSSSKIIINSTIDAENTVNINAEVHPLGKIRNKNSGNYKIQLHSAPIWNMDLELSATAGEIDFSNFKIKKLDIESNASALNFKLGNLYPNVTVNVESNASAVEITLPHDMKCTLKKAENNLSSFTVKGLKQESKNHYISDDEGETTGVVDIIIASNVSSVEIKRY
jgi:low affinity Fe/Cu permease